MASLSAENLAIASLRGPLRTASPTGHCPGPGGHLKDRVECMEEASSSGDDAEEDRLEVPTVPSDCLLQILLSLDKRSIACFSMVCTRWRDLCRQQGLWQHRFMVRVAVGTQLFTSPRSWRSCLELSCISRAQEDFCKAGTKSRLSSNEMGGSAVAYGCYSEQAKVRIPHGLENISAATMILSHRLKMLRGF